MGMQVLCVCERDELSNRPVCRLGRYVAGMWAGMLCSVMLPYITYHT